jgi:uncharacterized protein (DUF2147 family)
MIASHIGAGTGGTECLMIAIRSWIPLAGALLVAAAPPPAAPTAGNTPSSWEGTWRNTNNTVHLRAARCGSAMCGTVVWAIPKARADAKSGSGQDLIGRQLFQNFRPADDGTWKGKVFIPDLNTKASATVTPTGRDTMLVSGCLLFGLACKTQHWWRIG